MTRWLLRNYLRKSTKYDLDLALWQSQRFPAESRKLTHTGVSKRKKVMKLSLYDSQGTSNAMINVRNSACKLTAPSCPGSFGPGPGSARRADLHSRPMQYFRGRSCMRDSPPAAQAPALCLHPLVGKRRHPNQREAHRAS